MKREVIIATSWGLLVTVVLAGMIVIGSRNLAHFDAALVAYTAATFFATFGLTYRYAMWLQRPPTAIYWRRGWQAFFKRGHYSRNAVNWVRYVGNDILLNRFILVRDWLRGTAHLLIMWGCILAVAITFPLVFGWLHFESLLGDLHWYQAYIFGFPTFTFPVDSIFAFLMFHGLVLVSSDRWCDAGHAAAYARGERCGLADLQRGLHAAHSALCRKLDRVDAHRQLHLAEGLCV